MHSLEFGCLVPLTWDRASFVISDDQTTVLVQFQAVDDPPETYPVRVRLQFQFQPDGVHPARIFQQENALSQPVGVDDKGGPVSVRELQSCELRGGCELNNGPRKVFAECVREPSCWFPLVQQFECPVYERSLRRRNGRSLRQAVDVRVLKRSGTVPKRTHRTRRQGARHGARRIGHGSTVVPRTDNWRRRTERVAGNAYAP